MPGVEEKGPAEDDEVVLPNGFPPACPDPAFPNMLLPEEDGVVAEPLPAAEGPKENLGAC